MVKVDGKDRVQSLEGCLLPGSLAISLRTRGQLDGKQALAQAVLASYATALFMPGGRSCCQQELSGTKRRRERASDLSERNDPHK